MLGKSLVRENIIGENFTIFRHSIPWIPSIYFQIVSPFRVFVSYALVEKSSSEINIKGKSLYVL